MSNVFMDQKLWYQVTQTRHNRHFRTKCDSWSKVHFFWLSGGIIVKSRPKMYILTENYDLKWFRLGITCTFEADCGFPWKLLFMLIFLWKIVKKSAKAFLLDKNDSYKGFHVIDFPLRELRTRNNQLRARRVLQSDAVTDNAVEYTDVKSCRRFCR